MEGKTTEVAVADSALLTVNRGKFCKQCSALCQMEQKKRSVKKKRLRPVRQPTWEFCQGIMVEKEAKQEATGNSSM